MSLRPPRSVAHASRLVTATFLLLQPLLGGGCGLFYQSSYVGKSFVLYSDRDQEFMASTSGNLERIYTAYMNLFELDRRELGTTFILLDGDDHGVVDHSYSPNLLGYYVPLFNLIRIDTEPAWARSPGALHRVLLHEVSHHFIVTKFPGASRECWLNEGLAGALEVTRMDGDRFEFPLMHATLAALARKALSTGKDSPSLERLLDMGWDEFHEEEKKVTHYALSWSLVLFMLEHELDGEMPLRERISRLHEMDRDTIAAREVRWRQFVRDLDPTGYFIELASSQDSERELSSIWAIDQLGKLESLDDSRTVQALAGLFKCESERKRIGAYFAFLRVLNRNPHAYYTARPVARGALEHLRTLITDDRASVALRAALVEELGPTLPARFLWMATLVPLLEVLDPELRSVAAEALSRMAAKPTIVNPAFWRAAPVSARAEEVGEWKEWLEARRES